MLSVLLLVLQYKPVQTWAAKKAATYFSKEWKTKVSIGGLYLKPFSAVVLDSLYVLDQQKDTLASIPKLTVELNGFSLLTSMKNRKLDFSRIQLDNGSFYLKKLNDSTSNLDFIIDYFNKPDTTHHKNKPWTLVFERSVINNFHFRFKNLVRNAPTASRVNFDDIDVNHFSVEVLGMDLVHHVFKGDVRHLTLQEKSGFYLKDFNALATIDTNQILAQKLHIVTPHSNLKDYLRMRFSHFGDIGDNFEHKVMMDANFKSSEISSADIAYFTSSLNKTQFNLGIDGHVKGLVSNLKATHLTVTAGQATYLSGNFSLKGLPDWDNTFLELNFDQLATNKKDLDYLYNQFTGTNNRSVPAIAGKFGNINFKGRFTGFQNDFVAYGTFKTALGRFDPDVNLKISKAGVPSYSGKISTTNFDLGTLLDQSDIGRTTFIANIQGSGGELKNLNGKIGSRISYFTYKNYSYKNLLVNGTVNKKVFNGNININDNNIKLDLKGSADLNPARPVYNLTAKVADARLNTIHLLKDTITVSAQLNTQFSGSNLRNVVGKIQLSPVRVVDPRHNYVVDSLILSAQGSGRDRLIQLQSEVADGSIRGNYDLASLPSYFKTIVKKYIPSLKTSITPFKNQQFDFSLKIKKIDPLLVFFAPDLQIPDEGNFVGQFNSEDQTATLNGYVKTIQYGGTVLHDLILDESTNNDFMNLNVSLSKVDLSRNLYIKNINIANTLKKDSLNFNVKLSDKDATNQLDLYGLVEFGRDTTAKLKLLPSDVILEHERWKIQEQVRIRLLDNKTQVSGFELSNGTQKVGINGFISDNPEDQLKVEFDQFNMATFNQLTRPSGVELLGRLNGDVILSGITKTPAADAHLGIDSLTMNQTLVGDVKLVTSLDNDRKQLNTRLNIMNRGLETMNVTGVYNLGKEADSNLDFDVKMNQTEAIIFAPFVKDLVSNLKGTISTDLKMTGSASDPQLNGKVRLNNTSLTVNYLKTNYTLNDELTVDKSVIKINKLVLKDVRGNEATANGTVDLANLSNPDIEVTVNARNFMALNTTFKDNHLYYGVAYGTGTFSFKGPTDNMNIDIKASTEDGTVFNIPLNTSSTASDYDFIRFVSHKDTAKVIEQPNAFKGITLNLELRVDEKTLVKIATDYGRLEGRGVANNLKLNINSLGDFDMLGDFLISSGKFEFTAKDFISKNFTVDQGGTIRWTGNPGNADINLKAIYEVRTDVANLYQAAGLQLPSGNQQKLVQAELILTNTLLQPKIDFDFTFPTDPSIKDDLATYLNDESNRNQQALSLIIRRQFATGTGSNLTNQVAQTAEQALSEFAFNKLNTFISQSNIKNVDINIRSTSDASATLRFFNDRLILNGSLYSTNGTNNLFGANSSSFFNADINNFTKDFEVDYLIRKDGRLRGRYSYRALNSTTLNSINTLDVQYVNGVGLVYQRDFDTFGEFFRSIFRPGRTSRSAAKRDSIYNISVGVPDGE
jgi:autotransporter translocation and assembly factor TamB